MYRLNSSPKGALIDEAHFGYLAWSILDTGKDEHGVFLPLNFKGFGDDKLPLQVYLLVPVVKLFGVSVETIRYPSIILGSLLTVVLYLLSRRFGFSHKWSVLAAILVALSPWTFILSRFGFESNVALFFFCLGLLSFGYFLEKKQFFYLAGTAVSFALTWYSYIAYRPITVVLSLLLIGLLRYRKLVTNKQLAIFFIIFAVMIAPLFQKSVVGNNTTRLHQIGILSDPILGLEVNEFRNFCVSTFHSTAICYPVSNKYLTAGRMLVYRYLETFSPQYLATTGEKNEKFLTAQNFGQFPTITYPFFILGLVVMISSLVELIQNKKFTKTHLFEIFILLGLLVTPLPTILAGDAQKVRISSLFPFVVLTILLGARFAFDAIKSYKVLQYPFFLIVIGALFFQSTLIHIAIFY
jgi:4-amino-4-deoxy-L-arabinose transferase-like glycosyltransferase